MSGASGNLNIKPTAELIERIDAWRAHQQQVIGRIPPRAEAGRILIARALDNENADRSDGISVDE